VLKAGANCWWVDDAERIVVSVDATDQFAAFAKACCTAQRQALILGWDFEGHERLHRGDCQRELPDRPGGFLAKLITRRQGLKTCLLYEAVDEMVPEADLVDPPEPVSPEYFVAEYLPRNCRSMGRKRLIVFLAVLVALLVLAAAWRWTPLQDGLPFRSIRDEALKNPTPLNRSLIQLLPSANIS
jgi:hypothetical protein